MDGAMPLPRSVADADATLHEVAAEAVSCRRCPLWRDATHLVFGEGKASASLMLVGEQPGDREDRAGRVFVGPAGKVLDQALVAAGIDRALIYITNAVKHFKHEQRGKRRIHMKPNAGEVRQCRWWLEQELALVRPRLIVALGVTAAQALLGRNVVLSRERGRLLAFPDGHQGIVTTHPSAVLRARGEEVRDRMLDALVADLRQAAAMATQPQEETGT